MRHKDGFEACTRAYISKRKHGGYKEFPLPLKDDHNGRRQRCEIEHRKGDVEIAFEISSEFNTHGASAVHIGFYNGAFRDRHKIPADDRLRMGYLVFHVSEVVGKDVKVIKKFGARAIRLPYIRQNEGMLHLPLGRVGKF